MKICDLKYSWSHLGCRHGGRQITTFEGADQGGSIDCGDVGSGIGRERTGCEQSTGTYFRKAFVYCPVPIFYHRIFAGIIRQSVITLSISPCLTNLHAGNIFVLS